MKADLLETLTRCQAAPPDYFGPLLHLETENRATVGWVSQHRDSGALDRSNFAVILTDLRDRFPDGPDDETPIVDVDSSNHWAVGWVDVATVPALLDPDGPRTVANVHPAFVAAVEWKEKLDNYPVADEMHWSDLEYTELAEYVTDEAAAYWRRTYDDAMPAVYPDRVLAIVSEDCVSADDLPWAILEDALRDATGGIAAGVVTS